MYCSRCGKEIDTGSRFCGICGEAVNGQSVNQPGPTRTYYSTSPQPVARVKSLCLIAIIICAILWFAAPFLAINMVTLSSNSGQPTALQLATGGATAIGDISAEICAAVISIIGIVICFFCVLAKKNIATRVIAILTDITLAIVLIDVISAWQGYADITKVVGIGYIGIFVLLLVVIISSGKSHTVTDQSQQKYLVRDIHTPQPPKTPLQQSYSPPGQSSAIAKSTGGKGICIIAYIAILWIVGLASTHRNEKNIKFHVGQGIMLTISCVVGSFVLQIITALLSATMTTTEQIGGYTFNVPSPTAMVISLLFSLAFLITYLILMIIGIVHASKSVLKPLPVIGKWAFYGKNLYVNRHFLWTKMGGIPAFRFNGNEYLAIDDENKFLKLAYKGNTGAQHALGLYYILNDDIDKSLYWLCVAEYNDEKQATSQ